MLLVDLLFVIDDVALNFCQQVGLAAYRLKTR